MERQDACWECQCISVSKMFSLCLHYKTYFVSFSFFNTLVSRASLTVLFHFQF